MPPQDPRPLDSTAPTLEIPADAGAGVPRDTHVRAAPAAVQAAALAPTATPARSTPDTVYVDSERLLLGDAGRPDRYEARALLGEGGMGVVRQCRDRHIGRDVAMKIVRAGGRSDGPADPADSPRPDLVARFVREARLQGQLEHPAIVPVYDLGVGPDGKAYFTMKRVCGKTLEDVLRGLRHGDEAVRARFGRRKLLSAFLDVCQAVDYVHRRGVVHRDMKPANVMLCDFGEVYVLDWGLAKIVGLDEEAPHSVPLGASLAGGQTAAGAVMGTPGYMAPEQILSGGPVDARADIYALGAILYEILTTQPLHTGENVQAVVSSTLSGADARASVRAPRAEVPPELEAVCVKATAREPALRYASARDLHDAVERYLDGDRDLERRVALAGEYARAAEESAGIALRSGALDERSRALREVSQALALDPTNDSAKRTMMRLLVEPPAEMPAEARAEHDRFVQATMRHSARAADAAYATWLLYLPLGAWLGVRDRTTGTALCILLALTAVAGVAASRGWVRPSAPLLYVRLALSSIAVAVGARMFGPFVFVPAVVAVNTLAYVMQPIATRRWVIVAIGCLAVAVPAVLEWAGVLPASYAFRDGAMVVLPGMTDLPETPTRVFLLFASVSIVVTGALYVGRLRDLLAHAEERLHLHAWHLRQLVPDEARGVAEPPDEPPPPGCPVERLERFAGIQRA